jgi:hypothetical protein
MFSKLFIRDEKKRVLGGAKATKIHYFFTLLGFLLFSLVGVFGTGCGRGVGVNVSFGDWPDPMASIDWLSLIPLPIAGGYSGTVGRPFTPHPAIKKARVPTEKPKYNSDFIA